MEEEQGLHLTPRRRGMTLSAVFVFRAVSGAPQ